MVMVYRESNALFSSADGAHSFLNSKQHLILPWRHSVGSPNPSVALNVFTFLVGPSLLGTELFAVLRLPSTNALIGTRTTVL